MHAWVQREPESPHAIANANYFAAFWGLRERGCAIDFFTPDELDALPLERESLVVGGIGTVLKAFEILGVAYSPLDSIPASLRDFAARRVWRSTLGEVRALFDGRENAPVFIKPLPQDFKLFAGHVVSRFADLIKTGALPPETLVQCSESVPFASEYRCFVHRDEIVGARHYAGDWKLAPDWEMVQAGLEAFRERPIGCAMDWGVTPDGRTLLVEVNDGFALGAYGFSPNLYAALLADRWAQIVGAA
jgi:hypothetical protein